MDQGFAHDAIGIEVASALHEAIRRVTHWKIERFDTPIEWYAQKVANGRGTQRESALVAGLFAPGGSGDWHKVPAWIQDKADALFRSQVKMYDLTEWDGNLLLFNTTTLGGVELMWQAIIGATFTTNAGGSAPAQLSYYNNAQARLAIGDSSTAAAASQTWLQAATNKYAQGMDSTFPSMSDAHTVQFKATVTSLNANFAWNEFVTDNGNASTSTSTTYTGTSAINRVVSSQGTKASGQTWALTETIGLS